MSALPDPLTVEALADLVADPMWRDDEGRNLIQAVMTAYPQDGARRWREAVDLFEARACEASPRLRSDWPLQIIAGSHTKRGAQ